jgi:hypothetical protein
MRVLPSCDEGFRRLSVVLAVVAALGVIGLYGVVFQTTLDACYAAYHDQKDGKALIDKCVYPSLDRDRVAVWCAGIIGVVVAIYVTLLCTRSLGWIIAGFRKPSSH